MAREWLTIHAASAEVAEGLDELPTRSGRPTTSGCATDIEDAGGPTEVAEIERGARRLSVSRAGRSRESASTRQLMPAWRS